MTIASTFPPATTALPVDRHAVVDALDRLRAHRLFGGSPNLARFLDFVVTETLNGRGDRLKAYTIATCALGRPPEFDPAENPIVRVEATRLRRKLDIYYATDGRDDPLRIRLATGAYRVEFEPRPAGPAPAPAPAPPIIAPPRGAWSERRLAWVAGAALALATASLVVQLLALGLQPSRAASVDPAVSALGCETHGGEVASSSVP